jgi:hypothetical protein
MRKDWEKGIKKSGENSGSSGRGGDLFVIQLEFLHGDLFSFLVSKIRPVLILPEKALGK